MLLLLIAVRTPASVGFKKSVFVPLVVVKAVVRVSDMMGIAVVSVTP